MIEPSNEIPIIQNPTNHLIEAPRDDFGQRIFAITDATPEVVVRHLIADAIQRVDDSATAFELSIMTRDGANPELDRRRREYEELIKSTPTYPEGWNPKIPPIIDTDRIIKSLKKHVGIRRMAEPRGKSSRFHGEPEMLSRSKRESHIISRVKKPKRASASSSAYGANLSRVNTGDDLLNKAVMDELGFYFKIPNNLSPADRELRDVFVNDQADAFRSQGFPDPMDIGINDLVDRTPTDRTNEQ